jgi:hypothetical protein
VLTVHALIASGATAASTNVIFLNILMVFLPRSVVSCSPLSRSAGLNALHDGGRDDKRSRFIVGLLILAKTFHRTRFAPAGPRRGFLEKSRPRP